MTFAPECFWSLQPRATFRVIFEKFLLVPLLYFFRKCGFWVTLQKLQKLGQSGTFGGAFVFVQTRFSFKAIFEKFPLVPPWHFFRKCEFWVTL